MASNPIYPRLIRRIRALMIDTLVVIFIITTWWFSLPLLVQQSPYVKFAYPVTAWFVLDPLFVSIFAGTPGHYLMKLRIQSLKSGKNIGLPRAILRSILKTLTGSWSFILVLLTKRHQAIHDKLTFTTVVLREPEQHPDRDKISERLPDLTNYQYPPAPQRLFVMFAYTILSLILFVVVSELLVSEECLNYNRCNSSMEGLLAFTLSWLWFFGFAAILIFGWRAQLYGARRKPIKQN